VENTGNQVTCLRMYLFVGFRINRIEGTVAEELDKKV
jgi:hypothetical protein